VQPRPRKISEKFILSQKGKNFHPGLQKQILFRHQAQHVFNQPLVCAPRHCSMASRSSVPRN